MKVIGIGKNYVNDLSEIPSLKTGAQLIFTKPDSSIVEKNKNVPYPSITNEIVYEVELVVKIGKTAKDISVEDAASYISEIAVGIDYTATDVLKANRELKWPWALAKGFDGASPISSFKPISQFPNLNAINFDLKINGTLKQQGNTAMMIYNFAEIISYVSSFMTLNPGDLIFTGTPASGTGLIHKGDHLQATIEGELLLDFKMI